MASTFEQNLQTYADLVVKVGLNIRPGQRLVIRAPIETAPAIRLVAASAYRAGARLVDVMWSDEAITLTRFNYAPRDSFEEFPTWRTDGLLQAVQRGDAMLSVRANNPDLLAGQDPELISTAMQTAQKHMLPALEYTMRDAVNWLVIGVPTPDWAAKIFPTLKPDAQLQRLWDTIFDVCRINRPDPFAAWQAHIKKMTAVSDYLNHKQYAFLKYTGPGTDFRLGLPPGHIWKSAQSTSEAGIKFTANLPTEEVYTLPHNQMAEGVISASMPLNYEGMLIENINLTFAKGRVVKATAGSGEAVLQKLIDTDEGAGRLGEVALVPHSSPISQSGLLFYNTLYDENAACHLALGRAYRFCLRGGTTMSGDQFCAAGGNNSLVHIDFMIGSGSMDIDGLTTTGVAEPVMRRGEWAFTV